MVSCWWVMLREVFVLDETHKPHVAHVRIHDDTESNHFPVGLSIGDPCGKWIGFTSESESATRLRQVLPSGRRSNWFKECNIVQPTNQGISAESHNAPADTICVKFLVSSMLYISYVHQHPSRSVDFNIFFCTWSHVVEPFINQYIVQLGGTNCRQPKSNQREVPFFLVGKSVVQPEPFRAEWHPQSENPSVFETMVTSFEP